MQTPEEANIQPLDPQVERTRGAVLKAARDLLFTDGPEAITHQRVARAARVGRATLYRHWPERDDLLIDVLNSLDAPRSQPMSGGTGPAIEELHQALRAVRVALWGDLGTIFATLIARSEWDTRIQPIRQKVIDWTKESLVATIKLGIERSEFAPVLQPELIVSALMGFLVAHRFILGEPVTDGDIQELLDALLIQRT